MSPTLTKFVTAGTTYFKISSFIFVLDSKSREAMYVYFSQNTTDANEFKFLSLTKPTFIDY